MRRGAAVGECLIEREIRERQTTEWRMQAVTGVDADRAVAQINPVAT